MFQFYWPWMALLFVLPFALRWCFPQKKGSNPLATVHFPRLDRLKKAFSKQTVTGVRDVPFFILFSLGWLFLTLALMQPENVSQYRQVKNKGYDLMLAVDISGSMQAVDFSTSSKIISRLDATKDVVSHFVRNRQGDRVGLITFGEAAYLHVPLTLDTLSVSKMLNDTVSGMAGNATAIGDAIGLAVKSLRNRPEGSRVLILLTDGEDNASSIPPLESAKLAKQYGIKIYTIGVGRNGLVPFPTQFGGHALAQVTIDEKLLKEIAEMTGGHYFQATDQKMLQSIYSKINGLERTESDQTLFLIREPLYYYPLALSIILFFALSLYQIGVFRRGSYGI